MKKKLKTPFFARKAEIVARELIGKVLVRHVGGHRIEGIILETEAYGGADDPASHAFKGKTDRNWPMFDEAGLSYVYFIYGMHYCFNVSTGAKGEGGAVLIRGVFDLSTQEAVSGPGRVGKLFNFRIEDSGVCTTKADSQIFFEDRDISIESIESSTRIGIHKAIDKPWRFLGKLLQH